MESGHDAQVVSGDGKHTELLIQSKSVRVNNGQTDIGHVDGEQVIQAMESLWVHVFNSAVGDLDRGNILKTELLEELWTQ